MVSRVNSGSAASESPETSPSEASASEPVSAPQPESAAIQDLENQVKEKENKYLYLYAEFENFKRRSQKEAADLMKFGWEPVARDLLGVLDNLDRAIQHADPSANSSLLEGLKMVQQQFQSVLEKRGVQVIRTVGTPFDPDLHEAIGQEPSDLAPGNITQEHVRGYTLHGRLLRAAKVILSMGKPSGN